MLQFLSIVISIFAVFTALGLFSAVWIGRRRLGQPVPADPFSSAFGDVPYTGFTTRQLSILAPGLRSTDPLRRSLDFSASAGALQRNATGGRQVRPLIPAGRTPFGGKL